MDTELQNKFEQCWDKVKNESPRDLCKRKQVVGKTPSISPQAAEQIDKMMVEKWQDSDQTLWSLNKIMYAGVLTATSVKRESGNTAQTKLKKAINCKQRKVSGVRVKLSTLAAELNKKQARKIRQLKLHGINNSQLKVTIPQQKELTRVKLSQIKRLQSRLQCKETNNQYRSKFQTILEGCNRGER